MQHSLLWFDVQIALVNCLACPSNDNFPFLANVPDWQKFNLNSSACCILREKKSTKGSWINFFFLCLCFDSVWLHPMLSSDSAFILWFISLMKQHGRMSTLVSLWELFCGCDNHQLLPTGKLSKNSDLFDTDHRRAFRWQILITDTNEVSAS